MLPVHCRAGGFDVSGKSLGDKKWHCQVIANKLGLDGCRFAGTVARSIAIRSYSSNVFVMSSGDRTGFNKLAATRSANVSPRQVKTGPRPHFISTLGRPLEYNKQILCILLNCPRMPLPPMIRQISLSRASPPQFAH